jgi:hypothetical protein
MAGKRRQPKVTMEQARAELPGLIERLRQPERRRPVPPRTSPLTADEVAWFRAAVEDLRRRYDELMQGPGDNDLLGEL